MSQRDTSGHASDGPTDRGLSARSRRNVMTERRSRWIDELRDTLQSMTDAWTDAAVVRDELRAENERLLVEEFALSRLDEVARCRTRIAELEAVAGPPLSDCCGRFAVEHFPSAPVPGPQYMWCPNHDSPVIQTPMFVAWMESRRGSRAK